MIVKKLELLNLVNSNPSDSIELNDVVNYFTGDVDKPDLSKEFQTLATALIFDDNAPESAIYLKSELLIKVAPCNTKESLIEIFGEDGMEDIDYILSILDKLTGATEGSNDLITAILGSNPVADEYTDKQIELLLRIIIVLLVAEIPESGIFYTLMRPMTEITNFQNSKLETAVSKFRGSEVYKNLVLLGFKLNGVDLEDNLLNAIKDVIVYLTSSTLPLDNTVKSLVE